MTRARIFLSTLAFMCGVGFSQAPSGRDINEAIPLAFGQTFSDVAARQIRPNWVFQIVIPKGVEATFTVESTLPLALALYPPDSKEVANSIRLAQSNSTGGRATLTYLSPLTATYFFGTFVTGCCEGSAIFKLETRARGVPIDNPPLSIRSCVTGRIKSVTYSTIFLPFERADEMVIGDTRICTDCDLKPPMLPALDGKIQAAYDSGTEVEACFETRDGLLVKLRFYRSESQIPPAPPKL